MKTCGLSGSVALRRSGDRPGRQGSLKVAGLVFCGLLAAWMAAPAAGSEAFNTGWGTLTYYVVAKQVNMEVWCDPAGLCAPYWAYAPVAPGGVSNQANSGCGHNSDYGKLFWYGGEIHVWADIHLTLYVDPNTGKPMKASDGGQPVRVIPANSVITIGGGGTYTTCMWVPAYPHLRAWLRVATKTHDTGVIHRTTSGYNNFGPVSANVGTTPCCEVDAELYAYRERVYRDDQSYARAYLSGHCHLATPGPVFPKPDLKPDGVTGPTAPLEPAEPFAMGWLVMGPGNVDAPSSTTGVYLSADTKLDAGVDTLLAQEPCGEIAALESVSQTSTVTIPAEVAPGNYYLLVVADHTDAISELSETNNVAAVAVTIEPPEQENAPPVAVALVAGAENATVEQESLAGTTVALDGSFSSDPDGDHLTYGWDLDGNGEYDDATDALAEVTLNLGTHMVALRVQDPGGLSATDTAWVTVQDTTPPELTVNGSPSYEQDTLGGAFVSHYDVDVTVTDICDPEPEVRFYPPEGSTLPLGPNSVTAMATDHTGNSTIEEFIVVITDTTMPTVVPPPDVTVEQTELGGTPGAQVDLGGPDVEDLCDVDLTISNDAPEVFPLGQTTVLWTVTDDSGNTATAAQTVTVADTTPPTIVAPADVTAEQTSGDGTAVDLGQPEASDICDAAPAISNDAPAVFPLGETVVTWTATDTSGNSAAATHKVSIQDTTAPDIAAPADVTAEQANADGTAVALGSPTVSDICDAQPTLSNDAPAVFPLGTTVVTWTASDHSGNSAMGAQAVTVVDTTPPALTAPPAVTAPEADPHGTPVALGEATVSDICDAALDVANNAPALFPVGTTMVTWTATDDAGNTASAAQQVTVVPGPPQNQLSNVAKVIQYGVADGGIAPEIRDALMAKVNAALEALARGNPNDAKVAINDLKALINQVLAQTDKKITAEAAAQIIQRANRIIADLGG